MTQPDTAPGPHYQPGDLGRFCFVCGRPMVKALVQAEPHHNTHPSCDKMPKPPRKPRAPLTRRATPEQIALARAAITPTRPATDQAQPPLTAAQPSHEHPKTRQQDPDDHPVTRHEQPQDQEAQAGLGTPDSDLPWW